MEHVLLLLFAFLMLLPVGNSDRASAAAVSSDGIIVGTDISFEDITDFYYTYDASTAPPHYQRYRFYAEGEKRWFSHETREGGGWPQTESDITRSGTAELTEEQWAAFCDLLSGGAARRREESLDDGDAGPWLFVYWQGGEEEGRAFFFEPAGNLLAFEKFCETLAAPPGDHTLTRFSYYLSGDMMPRSWEITLREDEYWIQENAETPRLFPETLAAELMRAIADNGADSWHGVYETEYEVLDGEGFSLWMDFADGTCVRASGDNAFPHSYFDFQRDVLDIFMREKQAILAGTYRYEGEGFGGDFILTLNAEGDYTFSEGPLSSYIGAGTWDVYYNVVFLTEREDGLDLSFEFGIADDALVYLAGGSDPFVHIKVQDGECFRRLAVEGTVIRFLAAQNGKCID